MIKVNWILQPENMQWKFGWMVAIATYSTYTTNTLKIKKMKENQNCIYSMTSKSDICDPNFLGKTQSTWHTHRHCECSNFMSSFWHWIPFWGAVIQLKVDKSFLLVQIYLFYGLIIQTFCNMWLSNRNLLQAAASVYALMFDFLARI